MSGLEVIGAIASVAQLAQYVMGTNSSIFELCSVLRHAPKKFQQHAYTVKQLSEMIQLVQANQWLRSSSAVADILEDITQRVKEAQDLLRRAEPGGFSNVRTTTKYWKHFKNLRKESQIAGIFAELEKKKSSLSLCILEIQTKHSGEACCNTAKLLEVLPKLDSMHRDTFCVATALEPQPSPQDIQSTETRPDSPVSWGYESTVRSEFDSDITRVNSQSAGILLNAEGPGESRAVGSFYDGATASGQSCQINGDIGAGLFPMEKHRYYKITARDSSLQINGNITSDDLSFLSFRR